jgi:hypothetical protein
MLWSKAVPRWLVATEFMERRKRCGKAGMDDDGVGEGMLISIPREKSGKSSFIQR